MVELGTLIHQAKIVRCGEGDYPVLSMTMHDGLVFQNDKFNKTIASKDRSDYKVVNRNQLVISFPIDEGVLAAQRIVDAGIVSPAYGIWDINQELILPEFLEYALRCDRALSYYKAKLRGSTARRRSLPTPTLLAYTVPLPDISEQEHILNVVHKTQKVISGRTEEISLLDNLIKARFVEMFGAYPLNPMGWKKGTIRDVVADVRYGSSRPAVDGGKYPYLRMNNITYGGELDLSDVKRIDVPENELGKCTVCRGDVLFNRTNSKELVGKTCVYDRDEMMVLAGFVIRVRVNDLVLPEFLSAFLNTDFSKRTLLGMCKTAIGQANINAQEMQNIGIYIPPIELQREFVQFKNQTDKSKAIEAIYKTNTLFNITLNGGNRYDIRENEFKTDKSAGS